MEYISMNREKRELFLARLEDDVQLKSLSTTYRMYKYSKWYKELHAQLPQTAIITYTLAGEPEVSHFA